MYDKRQSKKKTFIKKEQQPIKREPQSQPRIKGTPSKTDKLDSKVKRIGPHIEIFQVFRGRKKFMITRKLIRMITIMQAHVRGWLERKRLQRIMTKASYHGPDVKAVINMYRRLIHRVRYRHGLWRTRQIVSLAELEEWMDRKKFYEIMFAKREDWQKIERGELPSFFSDCGHFPTQKQIDDTWDLVLQDGKEKYSELITKSKAIEMLFTLYPPEGANVPKSTRLTSTWLRPIVNGEEGYRYIGRLLRREHRRTPPPLAGISDIPPSLARSSDTPAPHRDPGKKPCQDLPNTILSHPGPTPRLPFCPIRAPLTLGTTNQTPPLPIKPHV
nr:uncharacterized protein IQCM [Aotus nancymaae]